MESEHAIAALAALAQHTRLQVFRALVAAEPAGMPAGDLARLVQTPANTLSAHLAILSRAGLVRGERKSRTIIYRAELDRLRDVLGFLVNDCCGGRPDICAPLLQDVSCCPDKAPAP